MAQEKVLVEDLSRKYVEEALRFLRLYQSKQTKLLYKEAPYQAVSFYENLLFALLLLRKKQHEEMLEGKKLLHKLLKFQNREKNSQDYGSFPADLTDFPACNDRALPTRVAYILEIFVRDFGQILGAELSGIILATQELLRPHLKLCGSSSCKIPKLETFYSELLQACPSLFPDELIADPSCLGNMLAALDYFPEYPWKEFLLDRAFLFWDEAFAMYRGPACGIFHAGKEQVCTIFDCWMSLHTGIPIQRGWTRESMLELALVHTGNVLGERKEVLFEEGAYSMFPAPQGTFAATFREVKPHLLRGFSPLRFVSGGRSVAWKFPHGALLSFEQKGSRFYGTVQRTDPQAPLLLEIFVERDRDVQFFIEGIKASLFNPSRGIEMRVGDASLNFVLEPCGAEVVGMLGMGNRPSQLFEKQSEEEPFDWVISCERIRGEELGQFSFCIDLE